MTHTDRMTPQADLAFLKSIAEGDGRPQHSIARGYFWAGLIYGAQILAMWGAWATRLPLTLPGWIALAAGPTAAFVAISIWWARRDRSATSPSPANRAIRAAFNGATLANIAIIWSIAIVASQREDFVLWLVYGAMIFAVQGAVWYVAFALRRRLWTLAVALGWCASAVLLGAAAGAGAVHVYLGIAAASLFGLMALPGAVMLHLARRSAS